MPKYDKQDIVKRIEKSTEQIGTIETDTILETVISIRRDLETNGQIDVMEEFNRVMTMIESFLPIQ